MKKQFLILVALSGLCLTGCAQMNTLFEDTLLEYSGIKDDQNYQDYLSYKENNELDENGYHIEIETSEAEQSAAPVNDDPTAAHITFAQNDNFSITYYSDAACTEELAAQGCYLTPGSTVYATVEPVVLPSGLRYELDGFRIYRFDGDVPTAVATQTLAEDHAVLTISEEFSGSEISIMPVSHHEASTAEGFYFDPSLYTVSHGKIRFLVNGEEITQPTTLPDGSVIDYEQDTAEDGYYLIKGSITVHGNVETHRQLTNIHFSATNKVTVKLQQPDCGGEVVYFADGEELTESTVMLASGTKISAKFEPWNGWYTNRQNEETQVQVVENTGNGEQTIDEYSDAFIEADEHKPTLTVAVSKSMGETAKIVVKADFSDGEKKECGYKSNPLGLDSDDAINKQRIGTPKGITIKLNNCALNADTAVKLLFETETTQKGKAQSVRYITNPAEPQEPFKLYADDEIADSSVVYKSVKITVSKVNVCSFTAPAAGAHTAVTVQSVETQATLSDGMLVEPSSEVTVTISPSEGYYLTGKSVKNDIYQSTMKFSEYQEKIEKIIDEHPAEKYCELALTESDKYGTYAYKRDGESVSGNVQAKIGQKLEMTYTVTASGYEVESSGGLPFGIGKDKKKGTASVTVGADMDGSTINRDTFGMKVNKESEQ